MKTSKYWIGLGLFAVAVSMPGKSALATEIASHRAIYELSLGKVEGVSRYSAVDGLVTRSVERTCDGWIVAEHMVLRVLTRVGGEIDREIRFTSWESHDGTDFRFASRVISKVGNEDKRVKGRLQVAKEGAAGKAIFAVPEGRVVDVPDETYLPVGHIRKLLAAATGGKRQVQFHLFDGSEEDGPELMSSFIVGPLEKSSGGKNDYIDKGNLASGPGWRVNAAFYDSTKTKATPTFQIEMELMANGLPRHMVLDLDDFSIVQALREVKTLPKPDC